MFSGLNKLSENVGKMLQNVQPVEHFCPKSVQWVEHFGIEDAPNFYNPLYVSPY